MHENLCLVLLTKYYSPSSSSLWRFELNLGFPHNRFCVLSKAFFVLHPNIITIIKYRQMRLAGHMACMSKKRNAYRESEGNSPLGRHSHTCEDNTNVHLHETERKSMACIHLTHAWASGELL